MSTAIKVLLIIGILFMLIPLSGAVGSKDYSEVCAWCGLLAVTISALVYEWRNHGNL